MTMNATGPTVHAVLHELGLPLPMWRDSSWTLTMLDGAPDAPARCRITLTEAEDLFIEVWDAGDATARYGFDADGRLVSLSHSRHFSGERFDALRGDVLAAIAHQCGTHDLDPATISNHRQPA